MATQTIHTGLNHHIETEYSVHACPKSIAKELRRIFGGIDLDFESTVSIVPFFFKAKVDLINFGVESDNEKDFLLEVFMQLAQSACDELTAAGYWADFTDPCSGLPFRGERGVSFYAEVETAQILLKYPVTNTGCCKVMSHPKWNTKVYPATLFTTAPAERIHQAIQNANSKEQ